MNVQLITANVGSLFEDESGTIKKAWCEVVCNHLSIRAPDFVCFAFQEIGGKSKKMANLESLAEYIVGQFVALGYQAYGLVVERRPDSSSFTAVGALYLWREGANIEIFNQQTKTFAPPVSQVSIVDVTESPYCLHEKFTGNSRKGYISSRWRLNGREMDLIGTHNFHDDDNTVAATSSVYVERRFVALRTILENCQIRPERLAFIFGDLNNRLNVKEFSEWAKEHYDCEVTMQARVFSFPEMQELFDDWHTQQQFVRQFDQEPTLFATEQEQTGGCLLYEPEVCFPMTFPLLDDNSGFAPTRPPAWCDRILVTKAGIELLGKLGQEKKRFQIELSTPGSEYNIISTEQKDIGDHKQVFLSFRVPKPQPN